MNTLYPEMGRQKGRMKLYGFMPFLRKRKPEDPKHWNPLYSIFEDDLVHIEAQIVNFHPME